MAAKESSYRGVMDDSYNTGRQTKSHLSFRYKVRGQVAVNGFRAYHPNMTEVNVLEMGAADGLTMLHMRDLLGGAGEYLGVEYAESLLGSAPTLPSNAKMIQGDVMALPDSVPADHYDLVSCLAVLEHLDRPQDAVDEAFRILKPGGVFVATCPNPFWDGLAGKFGLVQDEFHEVEVTGDLLVEYAQKAGFQNSEFHPFMWVFTGVLPYMDISLDPVLSLEIDDMIRRLGILNFSFVNQAVVAQKPY